MKKSLVLFCLLVFVTMIGVTGYASLQSNLMEGFQAMLGERWGVATLSDTYFGFLFIYLWIAYKETSLFKKIWWFILVMSLGTIAISFYVLIEIARLPKDAGFDQLLVKRS